MTYIFQKYCITPERVSKKSLVSFEKWIIKGRNVPETIDIGTNVRLEINNRIWYFYSISN